MRKISEGGEGGGGGEVGELDEYTEELVVDFNNILEEGLEGSKMNYDEQVRRDWLYNFDASVFSLWDVLNFFHAIEVLCG